MKKMILLKFHLTRQGVNLIYYNYTINIQKTVFFILAFR